MRQPSRFRYTNRMASTAALGSPAVKRISSRQTFFLKKVFPVIWFGFTAFFLFMVVGAGAQRQPGVAFALLPVAFMTLIGVVVMKKLVWDLADEVYDCGDSLLVRNARDEDRISLSNIMNVSVSTYVNPPRITLRLVQPGKFGNEVAFSPAMGFRLNPFAKCAIAEDLILRVDQARSVRARL